MKNKQDKKIALGRRLCSWSFGNDFWVKVYENGVKLRKRNQAEIILDDFEMSELKLILIKFFKDREEKKKNNDILKELEKENEKN